MLPLRLPLRLPGDGTTLRVLALGAHPDDIEIGAGGLLLLLARHGAVQVRAHVLTGTPERRAEAHEAARAFLGEADVTLRVHDLPDGRLPAVWTAVKSVIEGLSGWSPHLVIAPSRRDAHQDHRTIGEVVPTVFRDALCLAYELPKWDGDMRRPNLYVPLAPDVANRKVELLNKCFPSQHARDWWSDDLFLGLARLRGVECRAPFAEAFTCTKCTLSVP